MFVVDGWPVYYVLLLSMEARVNMLDPATLDALKAKAVTLKMELETVNKLKSSQGKALQRH